MPALNKYISLFCLLLFLAQLPLKINAQYNSKVWYFGNGAGIDFRSGNPEAIKNGRLFTEEGSATICDPNGNLMFYTNGVTIWDKNHSPMANGFGLNGGISTTQSAVIVPKPGTTNLFYVFTADEKAGEDGLSYSVIDLGEEESSETKRLRNTELITPELKQTKRKGVVTVKNQPILTPISEKLTAVPHSNGEDYWVICHKWNSNAFYAFPVTKSGIDMPVISKVGEYHKDQTGHNGESIGYLSPSPDGSKLASAISYRPDNDVEVFDFDQKSGKITNPVRIPTSGFAYGACFSEDNSKLYVTFLKGPVAIKQFDLNSRDLLSSGTVIATQTKDQRFGSIQMAPDGKIYIARAEPWLDLIQFPNAKGKACGYGERAVNLLPGSSVYGLPNTVKYHHLKSEKKPAEKDCDEEKPIVKLGNDTTLYCEEKLVLNAENEDAEFHWSNGDTTQTIEIREDGMYWLQVTQNNCVSADTINVLFEERPASFNYLQAFRPSNPMFNNTFEYSIQNVDQFELKIFSPKGKLVFQTENPKEKWAGNNKRGKELPGGEYNWSVSYISKCSGADPVTKKGSVLLQR